MLIPAGIFGSARHAAGGGGTLTGTFLQTTGDTTDLTTYTYAAQNLGTASADRVIAVVVAGRASTARTISSVTIAGVSATQVVVGGVTTNPIGIFTAAVPTGTTGDVVVTFDAAMLRTCIGAWAITGGVASSTTATGTTSANITGVTGGFIIAGADNTGSATFTWTNATEQFDAVTESAFTVSGADATTVGATTITATPSPGSSTGLVVAAFSP